MKKTLRMKLMLLLFALVAGITNVWADDTYVKVTSSSQVTVGSQIIIVCESDSKAMTATTTNYPGAAVTISSSTITLATSSNVCVLTIGGSSGNYTLTYDTDTKLCWKKNGFQTNNTTTNNHLWSISDSGVLTSNSTNSDASTRKNVRYNTSNTDKFGCYTSDTGNGTCIYVKQTTPTYTINAQSNNEQYGTVSLNGSVITGSPKSGCRYASPAYSVSPANSATVSQDGNAFTVTPSANTTVTINFEAIPKHTATFSVNGNTSQTASVAEGAAITFPSDPANISGRKFVGWVTEAIAEPTDEEPSFVNTATETMGSSNVTYYAVFATATASGDPVETKTQTLQYDTWTHGGSSTDKPNNSYRLFHDGGYVESSSFDLSKLSKVIVYGGTFGGDSYNSLTIGDGTNTWKNVTVSGSSQTGSNTYTGGTALTGTKALRVTSTCGSSSGNGSGVRMSKVEIFTMETPISYSNYCTSFEIYTITAVSNNNEYGTVSLSGEVITGAPKSGYRYASPAYTVTDGTATVSQSGNDFTVTPASNCTVQINFEAIPTYTLSIAVSPAAAGTVELTTSTGLLEGATSSATAAANAGYKFKNWSISGTGATLSSTTDNPTTVTIGTANATVTATFEAVTTYAITYSVNGVTNTVNVEENTAVDLSAPSSALIPVGYVFKGWRTSAISTPTDTEPTDYVTLATSTAAITYYAVMAVESFSNSTWTLDYEEANANGKSVKNDITLSYGNAVEYTAADGSTWTIKASKQTGMQINTGKNSSIKVPTCSGEIQSIAITCNSTAKKAVGFSSSDYSGSGTPTYLAEGSESTSQTLDLSNNSVTTGYIVPDGGNTQITKIIVTYKVTNHSGFCTSVSSVSLTEDETIAGDLNVSYTLTIPSGTTLTVNGTLTNTDPDHLIIEDGGKLITHNAVQATVKKNIEEATNWGTETTYDADGWYFIASPVDGADFPTGSVASQDIYQLDWANEKWLNLQSSGHSSLLDAGFTRGMGYLYASKDGNTISVAGEIQPLSDSDNATITLTTTGWHLIGNPLTCKVTVDKAFSELNNGSTVTNKEAYSVINPYQGIAVYKNTEGSETITFTKAASQNAAAPSNNSSLQMTLAKNVATRGNGNAVSVDNAIVSFNDDDVLPKFNMLEGNAKIFIPQGNEEYAIVSTNAQGEMPVNFVANEEGAYTITVNPENVEMNYLHLIDNIAGQDIDLLANPSYTFNGNADDYPSRFRLVFIANDVNQNDNENESFAFIGSDGQLIVNGTGTIQIIDMMGRVISTRSTEERISTNGMTPGVYVLRLIGEKVKTQKIVVR